MPFAIALIPVYNHASKIGAVLDGCLRHFKPEEILVVDDGSTDFSAAEAGKRIVHIRRHSTNLGKGRALVTGYNWAVLHDVEWVLTLDADGQHRPEEIPLFLEKAGQNRWDYLVGVRAFKAGKMPLHRFFSNTISSKLISHAAGISIPDSQCGYRMIRTSLLRQMNLKSVDYMIETEMLLLAAKLKASIEFVPVSIVYQDEKSHIKNLRITMRFIKTILAALRQKE